MKPYYEHGGITIYHGDCLYFRPVCDVIVTDPPYGIAYESGWDDSLPAIANDDDVSVRDAMLSTWDGPAIVFGSWKRPAPRSAHTCLIWDKGPASGMGDLSIPWKPNWEAIYVIGAGFSGTRDSAVLSGDCVPTWNSYSFGRQHPNEKPVSLLKRLIVKCPTGIVFDPFMGSGTTLRAAKDLGRKAIGIEIEERYCEIAAKRLAQEVFDFEVTRA